MSWPYDCREGLCIRCKNKMPRIAGNPVCALPPERGWPCLGWVVWIGPKDEGVHECSRFEREEVDPDGEES